MTMAEFLKNINWIVHFIKIEFLFLSRN
jgi:hypothetical protein